MKRVNAAVAATIIGALSLTALTPGTADAAARRKVDHRPCVSKAEFNGIRRNMTQQQVTSLVDIPGAQIAAVDNGYYEGAWVADGYWDESGYWDDEGYLDEAGDWIDNYVWVDTSEWIDTSYYDDYDHWVPQIDTIRTYKKCKSFDHGRSRVGINFDNYSSAWSGMRVYSKKRSNPWSYLGARTTDPVPGKPVPGSPARPAKPKAKPTTPRPNKPLTPRPSSTH